MRYKNDEVLKSFFSLPGLNPEAQQGSNMRWEDSATDGARILYSGDTLVAKRFPDGLILYQIERSRYVRGHYSKLTYFIRHDPAAQPGMAWQVWGTDMPIYLAKAYSELKAR